MLLVDDHQAEVGERGEHGRARAHADPRLAVAQAPPLVEALAEPELRVEDRDAIAEALLEAARGLGGERDLGHHHDRRAPLVERRLRGAQVDLGLAAPGHPVQQQRLVAPLAQRREHRAQRRLLGAGEHPPRQVAAGGRAAALDRRGAPRDLALADRDQPAAFEARERGVRHVQLRRRRGAAREPAERRVLARPQPHRPRSRQGVAPGGGQRGLEQLARGGARRGARGGPGAGRQHERQPARGGRAVRLGQPESQVDEVGRNSGLERRDRLHQPLGRDLGAIADAHDQPEHAAAPERHEQHGPHVDALHVTRNAVVERPAQGAGRGQRFDAGDRGHRPLNIGRRADGRGVVDGAAEAARPSGQSAALPRS